MRRRTLFYAALCVAAILAVLGVLPRWRQEMSHRFVAPLAEFGDLRAMATEEGIPFSEAWSWLSQQGLVGLVAGECTGEKLALGEMPLWFGPVSQLPDKTGFPGGDKSALGALRIAAESPLLPLVEEALKIKFPKHEKHLWENSVIFILPQRMEDLFEAGVLPDFGALEKTAAEKIPLLYRPAPSPGLDPSAGADLLRFVAEKYPHILGLSPSGAMVTGYPDTATLAAVGKEKKLPLAQVEFSRQLGAVSLNWRFYPLLLPLHSVTQEEVLSKRLDRRSMIDRMLRAVKERSLRLLLLRPYTVESGSRLKNFGEDIYSLRKGVESAGYRVEWPRCYSSWQGSLFGALALGLAMLFTLLQYLWRYGDTEENPLRPGGFLFLCGLGLALGLLGHFSGGFAKYLGALGAVFITTEAALSALERWEKPFSGILAGMFVLVVGGLSIAAFFGVPLYMLRLKTFSGVKATLLLPPLLVLLHDLRRRVHPESLGEILERPSLWGEFMLLAFAMGGMAFLALRSDNVSFVPQWEIMLRDSLEQILVARPRNKELFIGYPALALWYYVRRKDLWIRYREVFRVASVFAFASALNSFCHFHTPLYFTLFRVFNGLWSGLLLGGVCVLVLAFLLRFFRNGKNLLFS
ncbi:MAG TPA: DUF5693 family protein [Synergistaceae bacterium]|nr:DUF5693 family protein [Synergistaceae bacterium]HPQ37286.1 DUF5693 family protein [Synergistaceae bacterium]